LGADGRAFCLLPESWGGLAPLLVYKTSVFIYTTKTLHFMRLFSMIPAIGIATRISVK